MFCFAGDGAGVTADARVLIDDEPITSHDEAISAGIKYILAEQSVDRRQDFSR